MGRPSWQVKGGRTNERREEEGPTNDRLMIDTEDGERLEAELRRPDGPPRRTAVICHPHPQQGGSKDHPLLWAIRNDLAARGCAVLSFNFRGVMGSSGQYGGGVEEVADVRAAVGTAAPLGGGRVLVCGWSFGAHVALREAVDDDRVGGLALIGLPLGESALDLPPLPDRQRLRSFDRPVLLLAGEADPFCPLPDLRALAKRLPGSSVRVLQDTDHFYWRREREAAEIVGQFAEQSILG